MGKDHASVLSNGCFTLLLGAVGYATMKYRNKIFISIIATTLHATPLLQTTLGGLWPVPPVFFVRSPRSRTPDTRVGGVPSSSPYEKGNTLAANFKMRSTIIQRKE